MRRLWFGFCLMLAGTATADESTARSCTGIADKMARLACYDAAFGVTQVPNSAPSAASTGKPQRAPAAADVPPGKPQAAPAAPAGAAATAPDEAFGDTGHLKGSEKPVLPKKLTATILTAVSLGQGLYRLTLDNGQVWQTTQADWALDLAPHNSVTISRMTFGNYLISLTGQGRTVSIKRIQ